MSKRKVGDEGRVGMSNVNHPEHYNRHPTGIECIVIIEHFTFNIGNAMKYLWRAGDKSSDPIEDLEKAVWYTQREIDKLKAERER